MPAAPLRPRKAPRQQRALDTRRRLLDAAAHVFAEFGYARGTTNRIAEAAGHSIGSLYQYFPSKDAILVELATEHAREGFTAVQRRLADGLPESLEGKVRLCVRATLDNHRGSPALHRVLFEEAPRPPELRRLLRESEAAVVAAIAELLAADPVVHSADLELTARMVVATVESLVHRFLGWDRPGDTDRFEAELTAMLVGYLTGGGAAALD
ncbi:MAG TPA: TetR/AcrR family transcriptional regulator [Pseudonocardia sp.]|jgi:AcrR family transcriptional regulator|nr:TetR/AcrR family transcriptional regulator [Pseudonocardia sp.]